MVSTWSPVVCETEEQEVIRGCSVSYPTLLQELEKSFALCSTQAVLRTEVTNVDRNSGHWLVGVTEQIN